MSTCKVKAIQIDFRLVFSRFLNLRRNLGNVKEKLFPSISIDFLLSTDR